MGAKRIEELVAWQLAREFKLEAYRLVQDSVKAQRDLDYRRQLYRAAASGEANVAEGFHRFAPRDFSQFLRIARASIGEAKIHLQDGIDRGYFTPECCAEALSLANRAIGCMTSLANSLRSASAPKHPAPAPGTKAP